MNDNIKISVIIPIYNVEQYLDKCVKSIVNQTYKNLEIILVDDGSPDQCPDKCDEWAKKDSRITVIHKKNGGASSARNAGLDTAKGDYIAFVDGDDYLVPDMYEKMLDLIISYKAQASACAIVKESLNGYREVWADGSIKEFNKTDLLKWIGEASGLLPVSPCNKLFSASAVKSVRFDESLKYAEDVLFNFEVAQNIDKLVLKSEPYYVYVNNSASVSHLAFNENRFDEHRVMDMIFEMAKGDREVLKYCVKGDVLKSFRTIKRMCVSGNCVNRFEEMKERISVHRSEIFKSGIYSKATKFKTAFLLFAPSIYKLFIRIYGIYANRKYEKFTGNL